MYKALIYPIILAGALSCSDGVKPHPEPERPAATTGYTPISLTEQGQAYITLRKLVARDMWKPRPTLVTPEQEAGIRGCVDQAMGNAKANWLGATNPTFEEKIVDVCISLYVPPP